jgi:hypothetical protein
LPVKRMRDSVLAKALQRLPVWVQVHTAVSVVSKQAKPGRPRKDAVPATQVWQIQATVALLPATVEAEALRRAAYIIGTNLHARGSVAGRGRDRAVSRTNRGRKRIRFFERSALPRIVGLCQKTGAHHGPCLHHGAVAARSTSWPRCASASGWGRRVRPFPIKCANPRRVRPRAGSFSASRASISITRCGPMGHGRRRSYA